MTSERGRQRGCPISLTRLGSRSRDWDLAPSRSLRVGHSCGLGAGNRLVSVFVYLNSCAGAGGQTHFPLAGREGLRVPPVCGSALLWHNIDKCRDVAEMEQRSSQRISRDVASSCGTLSSARLGAMPRGRSERTAATERKLPAGAGCSTRGRCTRASRSNAEASGA